MTALVGRTAVVTGAAAGGLGERAAMCLAAAGAHVVLVDTVAQEDALHQTAAGLRSIGAECTVVPTDVTDEDAVEALAATRAASDATVLINAAGVMVRKSIVETTPAEFRHVLDVNVTGSWLMGRAFGPRMCTAGVGKIINIASVYADRVGPVPESAYYASKAAVANLTRSMASEFGASGVNVNCLALGVFYPTKMTAPLADAPDTLEWFTQRTLLKRLGDPNRDLDGPLLLLATPASDYITGQVIYVDGGWSAW